MYYISITGEFSGAHSLSEYPGECANIHGHNWKVKVITTCREVNEIGISIDFKILKTILNDVLSGFDHKDLNKLEYFESINPSAENISRIVFHEFKKKLPENVTLRSVEVFESDKYSARYEED
ncbi:6-pyruvoyl tetrahydropterin synthase family protein [candidate division KSB1 bacterium]